MANPRAGSNAQFDQERQLARLEQVQAHVAALEDEVRQLREMAALGELAAMIAHEVRNLMTPVVASAQRALRDPSDQARTRGALDRAVRCGSQAVGVADAILDLAIAGGASSTGADAARAGVGEAVELAMASLGERAEEIRLQPQGGEGHAVAMNPSALAQVLANLFANAIEASASGEPEIRVRAEVDPGGSTWNAPRVVVEVQDDGPGVPWGIRDSLFEPFVRQAAARPAGPAKPEGGGGQRRGGAGLGLAICRRLVERAGGSIELVDGDGLGACFRLTLPIAN